MSKNDTLPLYTKAMKLALMRHPLASADPARAIITVEWRILGQTLRLQPDYSGRRERNRCPSAARPRTAIADRERLWLVIDHKMRACDARVPQLDQRFRIAEAQSSRGTGCPDFVYFPLPMLNRFDDHQHRRFCRTRHGDPRHQQKRRPRSAHNLSSQHPVPPATCDRRPPQ